MNNIEVMMSSKKMDWETPQKFFDLLNKEFNFELDVCSSNENKKCLNHFTEEDNSLTKDWKGQVFCNPPYGREQMNFVKKAYEESLTNEGDIVLLIPARTDTKVWHDYIFGKAEIRFIKGRLKFEENGIPKESAPFPSAIIVYNKDKENKITTMERE